MRCNHVVSDQHSCICRNKKPQQSRVDTLAVNVIFILLANNDRENAK